MDHRIRNLFTLAGSVVTLSARSADTPKELTSIIRDRLDALARAHALATLPKRSDGSAEAEQPTTLQTLIRAIVSPYEEKGTSPRVEISGPDVPVSANLATGFALLLHEFATNAAKYGALSTTSGRIKIACSRIRRSRLIDMDRERRSSHRQAACQ